MNVLDYRETDEWGLSFELLVDGQSISALIGSRETSIPYRLIEDDLPPLPCDAEKYGPDVRILTVASCCGEYSCGNARCSVIYAGNVVLFSDFAGVVSAEGRKKVFQFSRRNYDDVVEAISWRAKWHFSEAK